MNDTTPTPAKPLFERFRHRRIVPLLLALVAAVAAGVIYYAGLVDFPSAAEATLWLRSFQDEWWSPLVFIGVFVVLAAAMIPPLPLSAAAAVIWGWQRGAVIDLIAASLGSIVPYYMSRLLLSRWVIHHVAPRFPNVFRRLGTDPFSAVFVLRVVGVVPFVALNYLSGAARIRFLPYFAGTVLGLAPPTVVFFYLVDSVAEGVLSQEGAAMRVFLAGLLTALLFLAGRYVGKRIAER